MAHLSEMVLGQMLNQAMDKDQHGQRLHTLRTALMVG